jgi:hypothetical protein
MKKISLAQAFNLLDQGNPILLDNNIVCYPQLSQIENNPDNEFLLFAWEEYGRDYCLKFNEGENEIVDISGKSMFLTDNEGDSIQIQILEPILLEV